MDIKAFLEAIAKVNTIWSIAAFSIAAILAVVNLYLSSSSKASRPLASVIWGVVVIICVLGIMPIAAHTYLESQRMKLLTIYRVRVMVLDPKGVPVSGATLRTTASNETATTFQGIAEIAIPKGSLPVDGKVTIYADLDSAYLHGHTDLQLTDDPNPSTKIELRYEGNAIVIGLVEDDSGRVVPAAAVAVLGGESGVTSRDGTFTLKTSAAVGQLVRLHAEKPGYKPVDQYHPAGPEPVTIVLIREGAPRHKKLQ